MSVDSHNRTSGNAPEVQNRLYGKPPLSPRYCPRFPAVHQGTDDGYGNRFFSVHPIGGLSRPAVPKAWRGVTRQPVAAASRRSPARRGPRGTAAARRAGGRRKRRRQGVEGAVGGLDARRRRIDHLKGENLPLAQEVDGGPGTNPKQIAHRGPLPSPGASPSSVVYAGPSRVIILVFLEPGAENSAMPALNSLWLRELLVRFCFPDIYNK